MESPKPPEQPNDTPASQVMRGMWICFGVNTVGFIIILALNNFSMGSLMGAALVLMVGQAFWAPVVLILLLSRHWRMATGIFAASCCSVTVAFGLCAGGIFTSVAGSAVPR